MSLKICKSITLALLLCGCIFTDAKASETVQLDGGALRAGAVALEQFSTILSKYSPKDETENFLSRIENYDVQVEVEENSYTFIFIPKPYKGSRLNGGGAFYKIRRNDYKLLDTKRYK